jgi:hypothetical protein
MCAQFPAEWCGKVTDVKTLRTQTSSATLLAGMLCSGVVGAAIARAALSLELGPVGDQD